MKNTLLKTAIESIAFQNKSFGKELESYIETIRELNVPLKKVVDPVLDKELSKIKDCIRRNTGIAVDLVLNNFLFNANIFAVFNLGHIFFNDDEVKSILPNKDQAIKKILSSKPEYTVNLKTGFIGSFFTKLENTIFLEYDGLILNKKVTTPEVVAVLLHELGHGFTSIEYMSRLLRTNQVLANIYQEKFETETIDTIRYKLRSYAEYMGENKNSLDDITYTDLKNKEVITSILIDRFVTKKTSEIGTPYYDSVSCEYLADQYAARYGYGLELVSVLQKLDPFSNGQKSRNSLTFRRFLEVQTWALWLAASFITFGSAIPFMFAILGIGFVKTVKEPTQATYDTLRVRSLRVKEQIIHNLKDTKLDNEKINDLLVQLDKVSLKINEMKPYESYFNKIITFMSSSKKDMKKAIELQRDLEELASNELFIKSAKLKTLTL